MTGQPLDLDAAPLLEQFRNALDCCGICAGGVLVRHVEAARANERERVTASVEAVLASSERHNSLVETVQLRRRIRAALASPTPTPESTR